MLNQKPGEEWRLLISNAESGAWNMALDEMLLEDMIRDADNPILRLYSWSPPCVSLGYSQTTSDIDESRLADLGWDMVRRPTGGRAILHIDELTYSIVARLDHIIAQGGVLQSYKRISKALLESVNILGINAKSIEKPPVTNSRILNSPVCFEKPSNYEIVCEQKKIIGSAQARRKGAMLQHGSFPLKGDISRISQILNYSSEYERSAAQKQIRDRAATAQDILQQEITWEVAVKAFVSGFENSLGIRFKYISITPNQYDHTKRISQTKYLDPRYIFLH